MTTIREEMWKARGILFNFAITDLKIRYKNSALGVLWSIVEPLLMLGVLFVVFPALHIDKNWQTHLEKISKNLQDIKFKEFKFKNNVPGILYFGLI